MKNIFDFLQNFNQFSMVILILSIGVLLSLKLHFFQIFGIRYIAKHTVATLLKKEKKGKSKQGLSPFQAVTTALAGTMGVGNIAGVSTALVAGGPGAIFWMWVSAFLGMITKYAEIYLSVKYQKKNAAGHYYGGPMYYMEKSKGGRLLACTFAIFCALCSFGIGNMTQINSVSAALHTTFQIPPILSGILVAALVALVIFGGLKRIAAVNEAIVPFMSIVYFCCAGAYLLIHRAELPRVLQSIISHAFAPPSVSGGVIGYSMKQAISIGLARGVFTNEAGLGSAPIAHAAADCKSPPQQAVWGVFEVFVDTMVVCTMTGLVVLTAQNGQLWKSGLDGAELTSTAFASTFGSFGSSFVAVAIVFFAVSSILGWCYYGEAALGYLCGNRQGSLHIYRYLYVGCIVLGAILELKTVWQLSDIFNTLMAIPNIIAIMLLHKQITLPPKK